MDPKKQYMHDHIFPEQREVCPPDCPNRKPGCHNAETCEAWAKHEKRTKKIYERRQKLAELRNWSVQ